MRLNHPFAPILVLLAMTFLTGIRCSSDHNSSNNNPPTKYRLKVAASFPHDTSAFTQGLVFAKGVLYESTGTYGGSSLRRLNLEKGSIEKIYALPHEVFAEGLTFMDGKFIQLTWKSGQGFVYEETKEGFALISDAAFTVAGEGWGLTQDGENLWMSDGSDALYKMDAGSKKVLSSVSVTNNGSRVTKINELEYIDGKIYANIWQTHEIYIIEPETGVVQGVISVDYDEIFDAKDRGKVDNYDRVLNGIAYNEMNKKIYITGKNWPKIFEVTLEESAVKK